MCVCFVSNMFTGIVQSCVPVVSFTHEGGHAVMTLLFPEDRVRGLQRGASVAIDGACLTVTEIDNARVSFDLMGETLAKTTLGQLKEGNQVNIERSASLGDEIGGHLLSGHITGTAEIVAIDHPENNHVLTFHVPPEWMKYIFPKGFIALDGASLTIVDVDKAAGAFTIWLIPETLRITTFGFKKTGDRVNVEIDSRTQTIVDTVQVLMHAVDKKGGLL